MGFEDLLFTTNYVLWGGVIAFALCLCIMAFRKGRGESNEVEKSNKTTWALFLLLIAIDGGIMLAWKLPVSGDALFLNLMERAFNSVFFLAAFIKVVNIEKSINNLKFYKGYWFSIVSAVNVCLNLFIDPDFLKTISPFQVVFIIIIFFGFAIFPIIYLYVAMKSSGDIKAGSLKVSAGAVLLGLGFLFRPENLDAYVSLGGLIPGLLPYLNLTSPISVLIGLLLIAWTIVKK